MRNLTAQTVIPNRRRNKRNMANSTARREAIDWVIRLRDPASADWEAFTDWLEASPVNSLAYDTAMLADADMVDHVVAQTAAPDVIPANDNSPGLLRRYGAVAAAVLVAVVAYPAYRVLTPTYNVETALGEQRSLTLDDGTVIDMNGGTRLTFDRRNSRLAMLETGEAQFHVTHDADHPFTVHVGDVRIQDVGTIFNVARESQQTDVSVAEGSVLFNPARQAVLLKPGQKLRMSGPEAEPVVSAVSIAQVGGWKSGRLDFTAATFEDIGPDLARALGRPIDVDTAIAANTFTGTIIIDRTDKNALGNVAALMGIAARKTDNGWQLTAK